jgi:cytochrome bd-type quinol oxidase subunit 2
MLAGAAAAWRCGSAGLFARVFAGLAWFFHPWVAPDRLPLQAAAAAPEGLRIILWGWPWCCP